MVTLEITGIGPLMGKLAHVGKPATQRRVIRAAVRKSGTPFNKVARQVAPRKHGRLKRSFKVRTYTNERGYPEAKFGSVSPVAHLLERGTTQRTTKSGANRGRVTARRFGVRAWNSTKYQIRKLLVQGISDGIDRELAKQGGGK